MFCIIIKRDNPERSDVMNIEQARQKLLAMQAEYEERITKINDHILHPQDELNQHWDDQAIIVSQNEMRANLLVEAKENLLLVKEALQRIEQNQYGYCAECGEEISEQRLLSVPYATHCVQHAQ